MEVFSFLGIRILKFVFMKTFKGFVSLVNCSNKRKYMKENNHYRFILTENMYKYLTIHEIT
jgi:hypothetical protein